MTLQRILGHLSLDGNPLVPHSELAIREREERTEGYWKNEPGKKIKLHFFILSDSSKIKIKPKALQLAHNPDVNAVSHVEGVLGGRTLLAE